MPKIICQYLDYVLHLGVLVPRYSNGQGNIQMFFRIWLATKSTYVFLVLRLKLIRREFCTTCSAESYNCNITKVSLMQVTLQALQCWKGYRTSCIIDSLHFKFKWAFLNIQIKLCSASLRTLKESVLRKRLYLYRLHCYTMRNNRTC